MSNIKNINKIIYFDKETIRNILQEQNKGSKTTQTDFTTSSKVDTQIGIETKVKLSVPFWDRFSFLFSGKLNTSFMIKRDSATTITSTELSEFEKLKKHLTEISDTLIYDIENSSTFFRVAGGYLRIVKGGVEEIDTKEFNSVMDGYDGYDTYKIDSNRYVRFNNSAFVSNYKRNDLLTTKMTLHCIYIGEFDKEKFDFIEQLNKMETLFSDVNQPKSLADVYPAKQSNTKVTENTETDTEDLDNNPVKIKLYDVVYACVMSGGTNG